MNPLLHHLGQLVHAIDCERIAKGGTWKELWIRGCFPGYSSPEASYTSTGKAITFTRSPDGPGVVTWAEFAEMIRRGLTPDLEAELTAALNDWGRYNHEPANRGDLTYASCVGRMRAACTQVVVNSIGATPAFEQLDLFEVAS